MPPEPAVFSRCSGHFSESSSAARITFPARAIARLTSPASAEPACSTTPPTPSAAPERSAIVSALSDLRRIVGSREAQLIR